MGRLAVLILSPARADDNNGNWQTAARWAGMLADDYEVRIGETWRDEPASVLVALHARKSAESIARWREQAAAKPLVVVLTGTDLYRDIHTDATAQRSLQLADRLVVLQPLGVHALPQTLRAKAVVCMQSAPPLPTPAKSAQSLLALAVGHLRAEKDPRTLFAAAAALGGRDDIHIDHIGGALDPVLGAEARALAQCQPRYRWLGALPHDATRERIRQAHLLVHPSVLEGGAHVVIEAVASGTPVLASRIDGNVGLLGADYRGYFDPGDALALARLLEQCRDDPQLLPALCAQCALCAPLFAPERERAVLLELMSDLLEPDR